MGGHICCLYILAIVNMWTFFYICTVLNTCFLFPRQFADILGTNQQFCVSTAQVTVQCFPQHQDPFLLLPANRSSCFTTSTPLPMLGTLCLCFFFKWLNHSCHCDKLKFMQCLQTLGGIQRVLGLLSYCWEKAMPSLWRPHVHLDRVLDSRKAKHPSPRKL